MQEKLIGKIITEIFLELITKHLSANKQRRRTKAHHTVRLKKSNTDMQAVEQLVQDHNTTRVDTLLTIPA